MFEGGLLGGVDNTGSVYVCEYMYEDVSDRAWYNVR